MLLKDGDFSSQQRNLSKCMIWLHQLAQHVRLDYNEI